MFRWYTYTRAKGHLIYLLASIPITHEFGYICSPILKMRTERLRDIE